MNDELLKKVVEMANKKYDGHFTLMKFTTDWRFCFGTISGRSDVMQMAAGKTMEEAVNKGIENDTNVFDFK